MGKFNWVKIILVSAALGLFSGTLPALAIAADPQESAAPVVLLDINTADAPAIAAALDGIGLVKAQEIVAYREMFGNFQSVDELAEVKGIGMVTLEKNRHRLKIVAN